MKNAREAHDEQAAGRVVLVGAGPGDPELLTLRAAKALAAADVLVHDGLVDPRVLDMAPDTATRISVAKKRARHTLPQEGINALLVEQARTGATVVRVKGGDPFVFGRIATGQARSASSRASARGCPIRTGRASRARGARSSSIWA